MQKFFYLLLFVSSLASAQNVDRFKSNVDSIKEKLANATEDSTKLKLYLEVIALYAYSIPDSAIKYVQEEISFAKKIKSDSALASLFSAYSIILNIVGDYSQALYYGLESVKIAERLNNYVVLVSAYNLLADNYKEAGDYQHAIYYNSKAKSTFERYIPPSGYKNIDTADKYLNILLSWALIYDRFNKPDSALKYLNIVNDYYIKVYGSMKWPIVFYLYGNYYYKRNDYATALHHYQLGSSLSININTDLMDNYNGTAKTFWKLNRTDSGIYYANKVLEISQKQQYPIAKLEALDLLAEIYKSNHNSDSTAKYLALIISTKDSLYNQQKVMQLQSMTFGEELRRQDIADQQRQYVNKIRTYAFAGGLLALLVITGVLWRNNQHKQKAYYLLQEQKAKTDQTLEELKSTQAQLIQSEKMASLGELTAGIAHEIQNPLNFVNNFSEVSNELIGEMVDEVDKGNTEEVKAIAQDVQQNLEKIIHHGKRADAIVKGMLQHSRASSGHKEPTDINKLADEYLRLSYQGLRAKDKSFNTEIKTDFDETIEKINAVPQDIGRVLLNLFNNAFYAAPLPPNGGFNNPQNKHEPTVWVTTKKLGNKILISVRDNGPGIPKNIIDKIFQPFFTTKPTGQGTGLGLSLSYDIVKAHGGEIKVETKEGEGSEFIVQLPI